MQPDRRLAQRRRLARALLVVERLLPALLPALGLLGAYAALALLGGLDHLSGLARAAGLALLTVAFVLLLLRLRRLTRPTPGQVDRRLEQGGRLAHQPLATLGDRAAGGDDMLWQAHRQRALRAAGHTRVGLPRLRPNRLAAALGAVLVALLALGVVVSGDRATDRLARAFAPDPTSDAQPPVLQAWATPPAYTGQSPLLLDPAQPAVTLPAGSQLLVEVTASAARPTLSLGDATQRLERLGGGSWQATRRLDKPGRLALAAGWHDLAAWQLTLEQAGPARLAWSAPPAPARDGLHLRLAWTAEQHWGIASLAAEFRLDGQPALPPLLVPIALQGHPKQAAGIQLADLTAHPWAGLPVSVRLVGRDVAGGGAEGPTVRLVLPQRRFIDPLARRLVEIRRALVAVPGDRAPAIEGLADVLSTAQAELLSAAELVNLQSVTSSLVHDKAADAVASAIDRLWQLALAVEQPDPARSREALAAARADLARQLAGDKPADPAALERQINALQAALQRRIEALLHQAAPHQAAPHQAAPDSHAAPPAHPAAGLADTFKGLRDSARQGDDAAVKARLSRLDAMLDKLQSPDAAAAMAAAQQASRQASQAASQAGRAAQQAQQRQTRALLDRQAALLDQVERRREADRRRDAASLAPGLENLDTPGGFDPDNGQPTPDFQQPAPPDPAEQQRRDIARAEEATAQHGLRDALTQLRRSRPAPGQPSSGSQPNEAGAQQGGSGQGQPGSGTGSRVGSGAGGANQALGEADQALGKADEAMQQAEQALVSGEDDAATAAQRQALAALQRGGQAMARQSAGSSQPGGQSGGEPGSSTSEADGSGGAEGGGDPFGRSDEGTNGLDGESDWRLPAAGQQARSRLILDELRRRGADRRRPQPELDYINRLISPF